MTEPTTTDAAFAHTVVDTEAGDAQSALGDAFDRTVVTGESGRDTLPPLARVTARTTVLPKAEVLGGERPELVVEERARYEIETRLGEGGVGEVFLAVDHDIDRRVAIKRLKATRDPSTLARFVEEIRTIGQLEHPNIAPIHDVGVDDDGNYYFVMKYMEGETIESVIDKLRAGDAETHRRFGYAERARVMLEILHAVRYAHARGIVHRDIKPANVMIGPFGEVAVMDWGLARALMHGQAEDVDASAHADEELDASAVRRRLFETRVGTLVGTPAYMSPEQARGDNDQIDERSDIYALGILFYEFLTLHHPLEGKRTLNAMLMAICNEDPPIAAMVTHPTQSQRVPVEWTHFIRHAIAKAPEDRYQNLEAMLTDLQLRMEGKFKVECMLSGIKRATTTVTQFVDRHPMVALSIVALSVVSTLGLGVYAVVS